MKMKQQDPNIRFRLEKVGINRHTVETEERGERGLEAPEEHWVELSAYRKNPAHPPVAEEDIVYEVIDGARKAGVTFLN